MNNIRCPCCGTIRLKPMPHVHSTTWTDDCCCSDQSTCLMHRQIEPSTGPTRPSDSEMRMRAERQAETRHKSWLQQKEKFERYEKVFKQKKHLIQHLKEHLAELLAKEHPHDDKSDINDCVCGELKELIENIEQVEGE